MEILKKIENNPIRKPTISVDYSKKSNLLCAVSTAVVHKRNCSLLNRLCKLSLENPSGIDKNHSFDLKTNEGILSGLGLFKNAKIKEFNEFYKKIKSK